jgi:hypothetical protein
MKCKISYDASNMEGIIEAYAIAALSVNVVTFVIISSRFTSPGTGWVARISAALIV